VQECKRNVLLRFHGNVSGTDCIVYIAFLVRGVQYLKVDRQLSLNISRQMLFIMVLLVWHYTITCAEVGKTVAREGRTSLGNPYQLNQSTIGAGAWTTPFLRVHNAVNSERTCIYFVKLFKTMSYAQCRQRFFEKFRRQAPVKSAIAKMIKKWKNAKKSCEDHGETCR